MGAPTVWILTHSRLGDRQQMEKLAAALGWPFLVKQLVFRPPNVPFLARLLLDGGASDSLAGPWPDLILCGEARTSVIARDLKRKSGGRTRIVCLGRPAGDPAQFDLVLTTAQYRLPKAANIVELALPLVVDAPAPSGDGLADLARPVTAALVGGTAVPERLDEAAASSLARDLLAHQHKTGGTLLVVTSPRTGAEAGAAMVRAITSPHVVHLWRKGEDNPYRRFLGAADEVVVTSDSVSMVADALAAGKRVSVYRLPRKATIKDAVVEALFARVHGEAPCPFWLKPARWLFDAGLIELRADRPRLFDRLVREGRLGWFGEMRAEKHFIAPDELDMILPRIRALF